MQRVSVVGEKEKDSICSKAAKGAPTEGASMPCEGKSTGRGRRKKVEESRGRRGGMCGQATRSAAKVEVELSRRAKKKSRGTLWKRRPRRDAIIRTRMVYKGSSSIVPNL